MTRNSQTVVLSINQSTSDGRYAILNVPEYSKKKLDLEFLEKFVASLFGKTSQNDVIDIYRNKLKENDVDCNVDPKLWTLSKSDAEILEKQFSFIYDDLVRNKLHNANQKSYTQDLAGLCVSSDTYCSLVRNNLLKIEPHFKLVNEQIMMDLTTTFVETSVDYDFTYDILLVQAVTEILAKIMNKVILTNGCHKFVTIGSVTMIYAQVLGNINELINLGDYVLDGIQTYSDDVINESIGYVELLRNVPRNVMMDYLQVWAINTNVVDYLDDNQLSSVGFLHNNQAYVLAKNDENSYNLLKC